MMKTRRLHLLHLLLLLVVAVVVNASEEEEEDTTNTNKQQYLRRKTLNYYSNNNNDNNNALLKKNIRVSGLATGDNVQISLSSNSANAEGVSYASASASTRNYDDEEDYAINDDLGRAQLPPFYPTPTSSPRRRPQPEVQQASQLQSPPGVEMAQLPPGVAAAQLPPIPGIGGPPAPLITRPPYFPPTPNIPIPAITRPPSPYVPVPAITLPPIPVITMPPIPDITIPPVPDFTAPPFPTITMMPIPVYTARPLPDYTAMPIPVYTAPPIPDYTAPPIPDYTAPPIPVYTVAPIPDVTFPPVTNPPVVNTAVVVVESEQSSNAATSSTTNTGGTTTTTTTTSGSGIISATDVNDLLEQMNMPGFPNFEIPEINEELGQYCFPGSTLVHVQNRGLVEMQTVNIGDSIAVRGKNVFEPIYSFGHYDPRGKAEMLEIQTSSSSTTTYSPSLQISLSHLIFIKDSTTTGPVPASSLKVGDQLLLQNDNEKTESSFATIQSLKKVTTSNGLYAPFTPSGELLVNGGIVVSSYVAIAKDNADDPKKKKTTTKNSSNTIQLLNGYLSIPHHWAAHAFQVPHRMVCHHFGRKCLKEHYTDGISTWAYMPLKIALSVWNLPSPIAKNMILVPFVGVLAILWAIEQLWLLLVLLLLPGYHGFTLLVVVVLGMIRYYYNNNNHHRTKKQKRI